MQFRVSATAGGRAYAAAPARPATALRACHSINTGRTLVRVCQEAGGVCGRPWWGAVSEEPRSLKNGERKHVMYTARAGTQVPCCASGPWVWDEQEQGSMCQILYIALLLHQA